MAEIRNRERYVLDLNHKINFFAYIMITVSSSDLRVIRTFIMVGIHIHLGY